MSTNKVYGDGPNRIRLRELDTRWDYADPPTSTAFAETFSIDQSKHSLFGASKVAADVMVQEYGRYFNMPTCCLRGGCLTGPNHSGVELHGFLSYLIKCNVEGREYKVFGYKGKQVRDNIHSEDVARFMFEFWKAPRVAEVYNLGGGKGQLPARFSKLFKWRRRSPASRMRYRYVDENRIGDHICYYSDLRKMKSALSGVGHHARSLPAFSRRSPPAGCARLRRVTRPPHESPDHRHLRLRRQLAGRERCWSAAERCQVSGIDNFMRPGSRDQSRRACANSAWHSSTATSACRAISNRLPRCRLGDRRRRQPQRAGRRRGRHQQPPAVEHNLFGTVNVLEYCKAQQAGLVLLSTSRVYSIPQLQAIPLNACGRRFSSRRRRAMPSRSLRARHREDFSTRAPVSLYGGTKLASEAMALEYGDDFRFPVWINRCGVLAGAGQFGTAEQGIFSYWMHAHARRRPLGFFGFGGRGLQVRDALHPHDLATVVIQPDQRHADRSSPAGSSIVAGGSANAMSLAQLTAWCDQRFGKHPATSNSATGLSMCHGSSSIRPVPRRPLPGSRR